MTRIHFIQGYSTVVDNCSTVECNLFRYKICVNRNYKQCFEYKQGDEQMQFAVVGIPEMSESQKELRTMYPEERIRQVKAADVLPELVMVKKNPVPKGSKIKAV